jgi:ABC-type transport system substrate-binding protein
MDPARRKSLAAELQRFMIDNMYWNNVSGSPFFMIAQPSVKNYTYNAEFEVNWGEVWLDK